MEEAVIVTAVRTPIGKAHTGTLKDARPDDLAALVIKEAVARTPGLEPADVEDVVLGCALPEGEQGLNVARIAAIRAGLPTSVPGMTVNRFCASGLQAIAIASERVMLGAADVIVAGGVESMSAVPIMGFRPAPNPVLVQEYPQLYMGMGYTAEEVAVRWGVSREDQDTFALRSHLRTAAAIDGGLFDAEIVPVDVERWAGDDENGADLRREQLTFRVDEGVRRDTSLEALARLRPAFRQGGSVPAGNSSQLSDGAAAVLVVSGEVAQSSDAPLKARIVASATSGVEPKDIFIAPVSAIEKVLEKAGMSLSDIDLVELNEAFAAQCLACMRPLGLDHKKTNVCGGAIALGHPIGASGARVLVTLLHALQSRGLRRGLASLCLGGGNAVAMIVDLQKS